MSYLALLIFLSHLAHTLSSSNEDLQTYIIQVQPQPNQEPENYHRSFLPNKTSSDQLLHSYTSVFPGFAAKLTKQELTDLSKKPGFIRVYENTIYPLHTTHTPDFLNLNPTTGAWKSSSFGKGVIIGVLDTGILPNHPSFSDSHMPPPPKRWKGKCDFFHNRGCNKKIIGARSFDISTPSDPVDVIGHGSHTASTIAGNFVDATHLFELANGTMSGIAPHAHLAIYKVCNHYGCSSADVLAGLDAAVKDGVDILSLSFGRPTKSFFLDPIDVGTFAAIQKGITVIASSGNEGPKPGVISNDAPWILTVGATTTDRTLRSIVNLNNGRFYNGESKYIPDTKLNNKPYVLKYHGDCSYKFENIEGKIVACDYDTEVPADVLSTDVIASGGAGLIIINSKSDAYTTKVRDMIIPYSVISYEDGLDVKKYINSTANPVGSLLYAGTVVEDPIAAPAVASFSSRGPSVKSAGILKPDVSGPGVNILAAWHTKIDPVSRFPVNIVSGTSMAASHVSGVAALVKSVHPDWSPSAIKSAIVTSTELVDREGNYMKNEQRKNASFFESGAGHVNPSKAMEPGLVYETSAEDYIAYVCGVYGQHGNLSVGTMDCTDEKSIPEWELNYPSISVPLTQKMVRVKRTVTNVGKPTSTYKLVVEMPKEFEIKVEPDVLKFEKVNEKQTFTVSVTANSYGEGNLKWVSDDAVVRSPIVIGVPPSK